MGRRRRREGADIAARGGLDVFLAPRRLLGGVHFAVAAHDPNAAGSASTEEASASTQATPPRAYSAVCSAHRTESGPDVRFGVSVERDTPVHLLAAPLACPDGAALRQHADLPQADDDGAEGALPEELRSQLRLEVLCLSLTPDGLTRELEGTDGAHVRPEVVALPC